VYRYDVDSSDSAAIASTSFNISERGREWGTTYHFRVSATNDNGTGPWAEIALRTTTTPGSVGEVEVCRVGDSNEYQVSWDTPEFDGFSPITHYKIDSGFYSETALSSPFTFIDPGSDKYYVWAYNENGRGAMSFGGYYFDWDDPCPGT